MSKFLNVPNGDYKIIVQPGGQITLDTGDSNGRVVITGDLIVQGITTTVNTTNLDIEDNIIYINKNEGNNPGITEGEAGIQIDRGSLSDALFLFDETINWQPPVGSLQQGAFVFKKADGNLVGIRTNSINTGGGNLNLINAGIGVISVTGTNNYENNVTDDDDIPNKRYVDDYVADFFTTNFQSRIDDGQLSKTFVETIDFETSGLPSKVEIGVDGSVVAAFYDNRLELNSIRISGTKIETIDSDADLELSAPGSNSVKINDSLIITESPYIDHTDGLIPVVDPNSPDNGIKLYSKPSQEGGTGLYFVNTNNTRDEIISRNRSLVFSMLF